MGTQFKVSEQPVTSEVRSITQRSEAVYWLTTPLKVAAESKFKHHRNFFIKPHRMIKFFFAKVKFKVDPVVKVRSRALRS